MFAQDLDTLHCDEFDLRTLLNVEPDVIRELLNQHQQLLRNRDPVLSKVKMHC